MRNRYLGYFSDTYPNPGVLDYPEQHVNLQQIRNRWESFLMTSRFASDIGIHVHIPFCTRKCDYCDCSSDKLDSSTSMSEYADLLVEEMAYLEETFRNEEFTRLYVGGGTPNVLTTRQLKVLLGEIKARFRFRDGSIRCIEFSPELTRKSKLEAVRRAGINRISLGVQSINQHVLQAVGRPGMNDTVAKKAVSLARDSGFEMLNVDLIYGLANESDDSFHQGIREMLALGPETLTIQLVHNSNVARVYHSEEHEQEIAAQYVLYAEKYLTSIHTVFPEYECHIRPRVCVIVKRAMKRPWDEWLDFYSIQDRVIVTTLGFGLFAHSKMHGELQYQNINRSLEFDPMADVYMTHEYTRELEAFIDAACGLMNAGLFSMNEIAERYGKLPPRLHKVIETLAASGQLRISGDQVFCVEGSSNPLLPAVNAIAERCQR